jgi:predicted metal-dependent hydrolase
VLGDPPPELDEFLRLYREGRFFDAHEALEAAWRRSDDPRMRFLQGLIQWAVAFEHHRRGNAHGARVLLERSWSRLRDAPGDAMGLDLVALRARHPALRRAFAEWEAGGARPPVSAPPIARRAPGGAGT